MEIIDITLQRDIAKKAAYNYYVLLETIGNYINANVSKMPFWNEGKGSFSSKSPYALCSMINKILTPPCPECCGRMEFHDLNTCYKNKKPHYYCLTANCGMTIQIEE